MDLTTKTSVELLELRLQIDRILKSKTFKVKDFQMQLDYIHSTDHHQEFPFLEHVEHYQLNISDNTSLDVKYGNIKEPCMLEHFCTKVTY